MNNKDDLVEEFFSLSKGNSPYAQAMNDLKRSPETALRLRCFLICTASEMLAQCYSGSLHQKHTAKRTKRFWMKYGRFSSGDAELLFQCRNAVIHNYGNFAWDAKNKRELRFRYGSYRKTVERQGTSVSIDVSRWQKMLSAAAERYAEDVLASDVRRENFMTVWRKMGTHRELNNGF